jgi:hypothetical protein
MKLELQIHSIDDQLPQSNWSPWTARYSKSCLVWNGLRRPSYAIYDRERRMWFCDDEINPEPKNWIDDVQFWAEIPDSDDLNLY